MFNWDKVFARRNWQNKPSQNTPINATNLNAGDYALNELDNRIISLDASKLDVTTANAMVKDVSFDEATGIFTVTRLNGTTFIIDTKLEKIAVNFRFDEERQALIIILDDGEEQVIDLSALITQYEFLDSDTIGFQVQSDGKIKAIVIDGSITENKLQPNFLADIKVQAKSAESSANSAASSADAAEYDAKLSQSYAVGGSGIREGEDTDNAKYYKEQASRSESNVEAFATSASNSADLAKSSAENAKISEDNAKSSETNALNSANEAETSKNSAASFADSASDSANVATEKASEASISASSANTYASNASAFATTAQEYAVGNTNSAKYYYEQAKDISEGLSGAIQPHGTLKFSELPLLENVESGWMYNISDEFVTTADFKEGSGLTIPAGSNIYKTSDGYWDILAGSPVTGVKGANETTFRRGNVNITASNVGAVPENGDASNVTVAFTSSDVADENATSWTSVTAITSGILNSTFFQRASQMFKNVRYLYKMLGTTDISAIGDGTATGAISSLKDDLTSIKSNALSELSANIVNVYNSVNNMYEFQSDGYLFLRGPAYPKTRLSALIYSANNKLLIQSIVGANGKGWGEYAIIYLRKGFKVYFDFDISANPDESIEAYVYYFI